MITNTFHDQLWENMWRCERTGHWGDTRPPSGWPREETLTSQCHTVPTMWGRGLHLDWGLQGPGLHQILFMWIGGLRYIQVKPCKYKLKIHRRASPSLKAPLMELKANLIYIIRWLNVNFLHYERSSAQHLLGYRVDQRSNRIRQVWRHAAWKQLCTDRCEGAGADEETCIIVLEYI